MAKMEVFYLNEDRSLRGSYYLNVTAVVGSNGVNLPSDVALVQALLAYLPDEWRGFPATKCPVITGSLDSVTRAAIEQYQKHHTPPPGSKVLQPYVTFGPMSPDGRVSPAKNGNYRYGSRSQIWTIVSLNLHAQLIGNRRGEDYMQDIIAQHSIIKNDILTPDV